MSVTASSSPLSKDRFGHPRGLPLLCVTEGFVSFAFYGFETLFALYMAHDLLTPERAGRIWGFGAINGAVRLIYGPQPLGAPMASAIAGLFLALVWVMPLFAGIVADRGLGRLPTIAGGGVLMSAGLFLLPIDRTFLTGLVFILLGYGGVGTLKAQVGALYARDDHRRASGYQVFSLSVQFAVISAPLLGGWITARFGGSTGFLLPAGVMLAGLIVYIAGRRTLPPDSGTDRMAAPALSLGSKGWLTIGFSWRFCR